MGANLISDGGTFRTWTLQSHIAFVIGHFNNLECDDASLLTLDHHGNWRGFIPRLCDWQRHWIVVWPAGAVGDLGEGVDSEPALLVKSLLNYYGLSGIAANTRGRRAIGT